MSYKVEFTDNTYFYGGNIEDSKWNEMPDKSIARLTYFFEGNKILLEGYEAYNHVVEHIYIVQSGKAILIPILMVKKGNEVLKVGWRRFKYEFGYDSSEYGKEWKGKPHPGWKLGIKNGTPKIEMI